MTNESERSEEHDRLVNDELNDENDLDSLNENATDVNKNETLYFASTNARSLPPKITSMIECFRELDLAFFAITETWLKNDESTKLSLEELNQNEKIRLLTRNRGSRGGGVAVAYDTTRANFSVVKLPRNRFEMMCCAGRVEKIPGQVVVFTVYLPPKMSAGVLGEFCDFLSDSIELVKERFDETTIIVTGDFNRKDISKAIQDFPEIEMIGTQATRGAARLDLTFTDRPRRVGICNVLPPLESNDGESTSDHSVLFYGMDFDRKKHFKKRTFTFRPYTKRGEELFGNLLLAHDWNCMELLAEPAEYMREVLDGMTSACFPEKTRTIFEGEPPWMNGKIRRLSRRKKREYKIARRSQRWKELDGEIQMEILQSKKNLLCRIKNDIQSSGNTRKYFKAVADLMRGDHEKVKSWKINDLFPQKTDREISEEVAEFFNSISQEYTPLDPNQRGTDASSRCPEIHEISAKLKWIKKLNSRVPGDIHPRLIQRYHDVLAIPLKHVYHRAYETATWPKLWKNETVTVIPKCSRPKDLSQLRNLSCTPLFSKVLESFVLKDLKKETRLNGSQFGGIKGSGVDHFLIETWDEVLRGLEDNRAAVSLASIDFEKAFNRVCHHKCLEAAKNMGASDLTLSMVRAFLTERTMVVKVNKEKSVPRYVPGGSPQGSIMGNYLFCVVTTQFNECVPTREDLLQVTPPFDDNGTERSDSDEGEIDLSPISRPIHDIALDSEEEEYEIRASNFIYFNPANRIDDTVVSVQAGQNTINEEFGYPEGWTEHPATIKVYIDDLNSIEKINQMNAISLISANKRELKVHSPMIERLFENISERADEIKMRVNQDKTQVLCIHASIHDNVTCYIRPLVKGNRKETVSGTSLKIVGFSFDGNPSVNFHVRLMCLKFRSKLWSLRQLKRSGMGQLDLLCVYKSVLRPVIEFACVTYGPMLTREMSEEIEKLQLRVMKIIYGVTVSYGTVLRETELETLEARRWERIRKFAIKAQKNEKYSAKWFPKARDHQYNTRRPKTFLEETSKTQRLYRSPIFTMRRILNEMIE